MPFCDPDVFIAGQLHHFPEVWKQIAAFSSYDRTDEVLDWIKHKVYLTNFFKPFKGNLKGVSYDSDMPPSTEFGNNKSCDGFQLHHAVDNMYKTIRFILEVSAEHRDYNNTLYYNNYIHII